METNDFTNQIWRSAWQSVVCEYQFSFLLGRGEKRSTVYNAEDFQLSYVSFW